ncbi:RNA polymerase II CTD NL1 interacting protein like phosphatase [Cryptosporidium ubiquitum]|uniref:peptidyl-tRNA hydrolase n=1 Tax=Cryptosporidium ubiquitum TaxID=857276 RepID=A0A1J4ML64_9CRYT|nr:RNA polymerase II CTD NL1 interacting protein like phosphatase [Cryptosporidium ubiquitum]OII73772.1 RNA polymerase II CTD NL1 interacting protein like phosphatase [Cryptosporidium ubiquitum]
MDRKDQIIQYILIRSDLGWSQGSIIAQACHASSAAIFENIEKESVKEYLREINEMRKVVLNCPDEKTLRSVSSDLKAKKILHKLWIELPENIPTCIATMMLVNAFLKCSRQNMLISPHASIFFIKNLNIQLLYKRSYRNVFERLGQKNCALLFKNHSRNFNYASCSGAKLNESRNLSKGLFGMGITICFGYFLIKKKAISVSEFCNKFENFNDWSYNLLLDQINKLIPPDNEPLLPDFDQLGYPENLPTLVVGLRGLICEITHSRKNGWGIVKRPGVDQFFNVLKNYYEIVIWSDESFPIPNEIIEKWNLPIIGILDKNHFSKTDGKLFKNLGCLGRNLNRVILVDNESYSAKIQHENSIVLPVFKGDPYDNELVSIIDLLKAAALQPGDVREYLKRFRCNNTKIGTKFNEYKKTISEKSQVQRRFSKFFLK